MSPAALGTAAGLVLVPGTGAMLAVYPPGRAGLATWIALAFALGYAAVGMTATVLVIAHVLTQASFLVALLQGQAAYRAAYPACNYFNADFNADGTVDASDVPGMVNCLLSGACP